jgi:hypothetical protein
VLDLNYGGGAGFAREYRERLKLNWGIVDADDCVNGAKFLAEQGLVDLRRLVISGGSATDEEQVVPGDALCGSCTSRIPSCWINLSSGTVASTLALLGSRGASGGSGLQPGSPFANYCMGNPILPLEDPKVGGRVATRQIS